MRAQEAQARTTLLRQLSEAIVPFIERFQSRHLDTTDRDDGTQSPETVVRLTNPMN